MPNKFVWDADEDIEITRAVEKAGTSEGAKLGWETRRGRKVYHGTASTRIKSIKNEGLTRKHVGDMWGKLSTGRGKKHVFVTKVREEARNFAEFASRGMSEAPPGKYAMPAVLTIRVPSQHVGKLLRDKRDNNDDNYQMPMDIPPSWIERIDVFDAFYGKWRQEKAWESGSEIVYIGLAILADDPDEKSYYYVEQQHPRGRNGQWVADEEPKEPETLESVYDIPEKQGDDTDERINSLLIKDVPTQDWMIHKGREWRDQMTNDEKWAADVYASDLYEPINDTLRGYSDIAALEATGRLDKFEYDMLIDHMTTAFTKNKLDEPIKVLRGIHDFAVADMLADNVGKVFTDKGFVSTTVSSGAARAFYQTALVSIKLPAGTPVVPGSDWEEEIILNRNSRFRVLSFDREKKRGELELILND